MRVIVHCGNCSDLDDEIENHQMMPDGPLYINNNKTQTQVYKCPVCTNFISISINTLKEQSDE